MLRLGTKQGVVARHYQQLRTEIKEQPAINTDDTAWRVGGAPAQMMVFESKPIVVYQIRPRHRNEEVREVIIAALCGARFDLKSKQDVTRWLKQHAKPSGKTK